MGVISVGASLGVAERSAGRAPSVSPSAASVAAAASANPPSLSGVSAPPALHIPTVAPVTTAAPHNSHYHHARRPHEYSYNNGPSPYAPVGGGRNKRGGRRKYAQQIHHQQHVQTVGAPSTSASANASIATASGTNIIHQFPPPPISTSTTTTPGAAALSSPAVKPLVARPATTGANVKSSTSTSAPSSPSQVVRAVTFEANVDAKLLMPLVLGAKGATRLQAFMAQSKCTIEYREAFAGPVNEEVVIRLKSGTQARLPSHTVPVAEKKMSFTLTADTTKRVDHAVRLLQGAMEHAEQILTCSQSGDQTSSAAVAATNVAVDSGGNGKPSSGHVSASRAAIPDHSIDDPPPSSRQSSSLLPSSSPSSHGYGHEMSRDSVDERKAQTRIRYPPTNQPLKRGPGFAPSRSIAEPSTSVTTSVQAVTTHPVGKNASKKRQLPTSGDEGARSESNKRERTSSSHETTVREAQPNSTPATVEQPTSSAQPGQVDKEGEADPEFDEFRIRLTRGIEFARQVDAQAARVKQRMLQEKHRYMQMIQQAQLVNQQQRVADVVIRTQCAIMATTESSGRKRRRIEQLSAAQDAMRMALPVHIRKSTMKSATGTRQSSSRLNAFSHSTELAALMSKISAFRAAVSKKVDSRPKEDSTQAAGASETAATQQPPSSNLSKQEAEPPKCAVITSSESQEVGSAEPNEVDKQDETFRPRHLAPGILRDMNLIQDYTSESDCALLHLLIGQRQYFYLEPISLSFGLNDLERLQTEAVRTVNDLEVMREFVMKHRRFGGDLLKSVEAVASNSTPALASSKDSSWASMQRSLLELHPLMLVLHLLAMHYHAITILEQKKVVFSLSKPDLLSNEEELSSDLFKFVLRPIRSSAIESSLNDALPISLVRETIAHCPEVVNHVLDWKEESDVPPVLLRDVTSMQQKKDKAPSSSGTSMLSETLKHFQRHANDFDRGMSEFARHFQGLRSGTVSGDKVVHLVNQLKTLGARLLVVNTQLQLHKWATVFVENGFSWFDEDIEDDLDGNTGLNGDRSYDKFTCLQDALFVWHNAKLSYSAKEEQDASEVDLIDTLRQDNVEPESEEAIDPSSEEKEDPELAQLRRVTSPEVLNIVETSFTHPQAVAKFFLTSEDIALARKEFNDSLSAMRASMKVLGRTAPWRTHVKHSNGLKAEYTKQRELENKFLLHQWAAYYKNRPLPYRQQEPDNYHADANIDDKAENPGGEQAQRPDEEMKEATSDTPADSSDANTDTGIVLEPGDTPEVVDMKLLRHEIENVAKQMHTMGDTDRVDPDRKKLLDACSLLAASCVSALTKFLSHDEPPGLSDASKSGAASSRGTRLRANSASKNSKSDQGDADGDYEPSRKQPKPKQRSKMRAPSEDTVVSAATQVQEDRLPTETPVHATTTDGGHEQSTSVKRAKKGSAMSTARRSRAHSTSSASPRAPPTVAPVQSVPPISSRGNASKGTTAHVSTTASMQLTAEPLRMGCSGCRDTRRRCTGCHGCCLHCVCLGCGCRMCCSSRTASVQKTLNLLVTAVETRMGCKWIELDSMTDRSERCGMVKACAACQQCNSHCKCHPSARASHPDCVSSSQPSGAGSWASVSATAGFPSTAARKERRFRINPTAAQRRQNQTSGCSDDDTNGPSNRRRGMASATPTKRTRRSNSDATPLMFKDDSADSTTASDFMSSEFSGSSTDGIPFVSTNPPAQHKNEQEDLFRAARVRMKLQRNAFMKASNPYGLIPPNTLIEGEMLWHPDRIRLMWERKDVYGVLGVPREATSQLIKKQYRKLVLKLHPDKAQGTSEVSDATAQTPGEAWSLDDRVSAFVAVTQAYKLLSGDIGAIHNNGWKTTP